MKTAASLVRWYCLPLVAFAGIVNPLNAADFWWEAGPAMRGGMQFEVSGSSYVQMLGVHAAPAPLVEPASVGPRGAYADRLYDDGYVKLDEGTLNPDAVGGPGNTWNWAYDEGSQFSALNSTLSFHKQGDVGYTTLRDIPVEGEDSATGAGVQVNAGWKVAQNEKWRVDLGVGFQVIWETCSRIRLSSYLERTSRYDVTDTYGVAETVDPETGFPLPQTSPGGYAGQFSVPGPVITNVPASRTSTRTDLSTAQNEVDFRFTTDFYELTFSPRFTYAASESIALHLTPKLGLSYLEVTADRAETFVETATGGGSTTLGSWHDRRTECAWRFALGITAGVDLDLGDDYYAGLFGGYEWVVNDVRLAVGPNTVTFNGSGFVAGVVIGQRF